MKWDTRRTFETAGEFSFFCLRTKQKFIHFAISLKAIKTDFSYSEYSIFVNHIIRQFDFEPGEETFVSNAREMILQAVSSKEFSFRSIERIFTKYHL